MEQYKKWMVVNCRNIESTITVESRLTINFLQWLSSKNKTIEDINQDLIDTYLSVCYEKYHPNSMVVITANLRKFCIHFLGKKVAIKTARMKSPDRDKTPLTKSEIKAMFDVVKNNPLKSAVVKTLYYSAVRKMELINLKISDIDCTRCQITVKHGKGDRRRVVNITKDCLFSIQRWLQVRPRPKDGYEDTLFLSTTRQKMSSCFLTSIIKRAAARAGIQKTVYPHLFRITAITHMAEAGLTPREIQAQSGHQDISTLLGYIQSTPSRIRSAYEKVFEDIELSNEDTKKISQRNLLSEEQYKKMAFQKYLNGDIDRATLDSLLSTFEHTSDKKNQQRDLAYG